MDKIAEYLMEQTQKNTTQLFELMKGSVTDWADLVSWAQNEVEQITGRLTEEGKAQIVARLEKLQAQQAESQKEFQEQLDGLVKLFRQEGK